jgi:RNA polymerase sigma-70 factor, ECF subfamily
MINHYSKYNDNELIDFLKGSKVQSDEAFSEIYKRYSNNVKKYCISMIGNLDDASDLFQETFIRFYNNARMLQRGNILALLIITARSLCLNRLRNQKITVPLDTQDLISFEHNDYENTELFTIIMNSLILLEEKYREAFILRELEGLPFTKIAEMCEISVDNAKARAIRAKQKLIEILEPYIKDLCK